MNKSVKVVGFDLALNHMAAVELTDGVMTNHWFVTSIAASARAGGDRCHRLRQTKSKERQVVQIHRLSQLENFIGSTVLGESNPDYVGIEDYAIRAEQGAHYMGEVGGICRLICWHKGIPYRLHDPQSVKMFISHDGTCQKDTVEASIKSRFGVDFGAYNAPRPKPTARNPKPKQNRTTSEDLCDAYAVAFMVWTEIQLRHGEIMLKDLHQKEIQVFNRVTKTYPISLLDREWIKNPSSDEREQPKKENKEIVKKKSKIKIFRREKNGTR